VPTGHAPVLEGSRIDLAAAKINKGLNMNMDGRGKKLKS
jgi:hypothetical protein